MDKKSDFSTVYDQSEAGAVAFETREELAPAIDEYLDVVAGLLSDYVQEPGLIEGLSEVEMKLKALRVSEEPLEELRKKLESLTEIPFGSEKNINLSAFRKKTGAGKFATEEEYVAHVKKLVRNTSSNLAQLLSFSPDDTILQKFLANLQALDPDGEYRNVRMDMFKLSQAPQLWHYNEKKKEFLLEWLRPYQAELGKPVEELSGEALQAALKQVEQLRESKLEEMTNLSLENDRGPYRRFNKTMHPIMNGKNAEFWGGIEVRDEFVAMMSKIVRRFSFSLEDRYLVFKTRTVGFSYLVGFADEAFDDILSLGDGKMALYPHLKVFLHGANGEFHEIAESDYPASRSAYFNALKTAVVPFLTAISVMVESELSPNIKQSFDMWA